MKILITGASGFLGKELLNLLDKEKKFEIFSISRSKNKKYIFCDLEKKLSIQKLLKKIKPDIIINLAAKINFKEKSLYKLKLNYLLPKIFANYCKKNNKYLIHISTIAVHGSKILCGQRTKINPKNIYGISKARGDINIIKSQCNYTIIRFPGIFGRDGPDHLYINKLIKMKNIREITLNNSGNQKRNYIFVKDAAKVILKSLNKKNKIIYIGGQVLSFKKMLNIIKIKSLIKKITYKNKLTRDELIKSNYKFKFTSFKRAVRSIYK